MIIMCIVREKKHREMVRGTGRRAGRNDAQKISARNVPSDAQTFDGTGFAREPPLRCTLNFRNLAD